MKDIGGLRVFPSETNFLLVKILKKGVYVNSFEGEAGHEGILIRDCSTFVGLDDSFFRVTVRSADENAKLIASMKKIL